MVAGQGPKYAVDLVICIDATGSMSGIIENTKASALNFHQRLEAKMAEKSAAEAEKKAQAEVEASKPETEASSKDEAPKQAEKAEGA